MRTRHKPYIRWNKETDEWTMKAVEETYIEKIPNRIREKYGHIKF